MKKDPFGNLKDWGQVLEILEELSNNGRLADCQPGLIRILRYKGNWRLRETVLKRAGEITVPSNELVYQVIAMIADDNLYYDLRVIAAQALRNLLKNRHSDSSEVLLSAVRQTTQKLGAIPQPPFFNSALSRLCSDIGMFEQ